jgi:hypothetical protein
MKRHLISFMYFLSIFFSSVREYSPVDDDKKESALDHAKRLSEAGNTGGKSNDELNTFLRELGDKKDASSLADIYKSGFPGSEQAAAVYCQVVGTDRAIALCATLELGSGVWRCAVAGLTEQPKDRIVGYLKQVATSNDPKVRAFCYYLCQAKKWRELIPQAKQDLESQEPHGLPSSFRGTLGEIAKDYIKSCNNR